MITKEDILKQFGTYIAASKALDFKVRASIDKLADPLTDSQARNVIRRMKANGLAVPDSWK